MIRRSLACFACGVVCTALFALAGEVGLRRNFQWEAWQHGAGYFEWSVYDDRFVWHWYES
jgi:hypothetical protein